jgi:crotonobetainyl-CoA:carnitine CoA-transferase CaiB-like acyl-CoA transferase
MSGPLRDLRVLDCSLGTAGPQATGLLADYGADVVWIEPPGGDPLRRLQPGAASAYNRGKRSIVLDLERAKDKEALMSLVDWADVFVGSWGADKAGALGLGYSSLHARNPQLICCSVTGFEADPKYRHLPSYEPLVHALFGTMAVQVGHRDGPIFQGMPFASSGAAQLAVVGILAALHRRFEDGVGRHVETSMVDGAMAFHSMLWGESDASLGQPLQVDPRTVGRPSARRIVTRSFICADGQYLGIHTGAVGAFGRLMQVLGLDDRIPPVVAGFDMGTPLTPEQSELVESKIHGIFASQPRAYWVDTLKKADVCAVEHLSPTVVFDEPQARHNQMVISLMDPVLGDIEQVAPGIRFEGIAPGIPKPAPLPGQEGADVTKFQGVGPSNWRALQTGSPDRRPLLAGVKVLDIGAYYAGPYSSRLLADMGADVIKLEPTAGDQLRGIERPFFSAQAGKRSIAANIKEQALKPAQERLIKWADVVHHNMRPGAAERLGLGKDQVRAINPSAIYLYAPGWGSTGPHMLRQSFAPMLSGYVGASYEVAGQYNEPLPSTGNEDPGNGLLGAIAILISLLHRRRTGSALACENPQLNASMGMMLHVVRKDGEAIGAGRLDVMQMGVEALESLYTTSDGWICLVARSDEEISALQTVLGIDILGDERFGSADARRAAREELSDVLRPLFEARSTAEWIRILAESRVTAVEPAGSDFPHRFMNDPEQRPLGRVAEVVHPEKGKVREFANLVRVSDAEVPAHRLAPGLGEHTDRILKWLDYSGEQIDELRKLKVIR